MLHSAVKYLSIDEVFKLDTLKKLCFKVDHDKDDEVLHLHLCSAAQYAEQFLRKSYFKKKVDCSFKLERSDTICMPITPVAEIIDLSVDQRNEQELIPQCKWSANTGVMQLPRKLSAEVALSYVTKSVSAPRDVLNGIVKHASLLYDPLPGEDVLATVNQFYALHRKVLI